MAFDRLRICREAYHTTADLGRRQRAFALVMRMMERNVARKRARDYRAMVAPPA